MLPLTQGIKLMKAVSMGVKVAGVSGRGYISGNL